MNHPFPNDSEILRALQGNSRAIANAALKQLYQSDKLLNSIRKQVRGLGGSGDDVKELMSEALVIFFNDAVEGVYNPALGTITTYIVAIAKKRCLTQRRSENRRMARQGRFFDLGSIETVADPELELNLEYRKALLDKLLSKTGERCHQLLKLRSFGYSMVEIAELMQYNNQAVAKSAARDCREKLNNYLAANPSLLAALKEL